MSYPAYKLRGGQPAPKTQRAPEPTERVLAIVRETAREFDLSAKDILSTDRRTIVVAARDAAIYRVRNTPDAMGRLPSTTTLGRWFGRDHSSVVVALQREEARIYVRAEAA